jgi:glutaredoxin 3
MPKIIIYTQPNCKNSEKIKHVLSAKDVFFEERDVSKEVYYKREMIERTGGKKTTPQVFVDGRLVHSHVDLEKIVNG